jgi:arylsulfatase A-like enzyme
MNRRDMIKNALLSAGALGAKGAAAQAPATNSPEHHNFPSPPGKTSGERMRNILWVCTDQQRFDTIQGLSNDVIKTPNLQKVMADSATFTDAFCAVPNLLAFLREFFSGRYPHVTDLRANGQRIRPTEQLVTRILADNEYTCGLSGKLHLSPCFGGRIENRIDDGYEVFHWSHDISDTWPLKNEWYVWLD